MWTPIRQADRGVGDELETPKVNKAESDVAWQVRHNVAVGLLRSRLRELWVSIWEGVTYF